MEPHKHMEPPKFAKPISGVQSKDGEQAVFEAIVAGSPLPEVTWFREGHQITHSEDFHVSFNTTSHTNN